MSVLKAVRWDGEPFSPAGKNNSLSLSEAVEVTGTASGLGKVYHAPQVDCTVTVRDCVEMITYLLLYVLYITLTTTTT